MPPLSLPRKLLLTMAALVVLVSLIWCGGILYWHWRLREGIRAIELFYAANAGSVGYPDRGGKTGVLVTAGCRSLPYLVDALNDTRDSRVQKDVMNRILANLAGPGRPDDRAIADAKERGVRWEIVAYGPAPAREEKIADFNAWWKVHRSRYHQAWRFWSAWCPGD